MRCVVSVLFALLSALGASLIAPSAFAEPAPKPLEGMDLATVFSPTSRWVYHYTRTAPEGHPDESLTRDHFLVWTVDAPPAPDGAGGTLLSFKEEGGPDDKATRKVTWRIDASGCWSKDLDKGKSTPPMCPNTAIKAIEVMLPGDISLSDIFGMESGDHAALISPTKGLASYSVEHPNGVIETWTLEGFRVNGDNAGIHDLKPTRCDWDASLRDLPQDAPTTLTLGSKRDPLTVVLDPVASTLTLSRGAKVIGQVCTPSVGSEPGNVTLKSLKGWVASDDAAYITLHADIFWDGAEGSHDHSALVLRVFKESVSPVQSFEVISYDTSESDKVSFPGPMLMQSGDECVVEFWLSDKRDSPPTKTIAAFPLSGSWPLVQARGSLTPTLATSPMPNRKTFDPASCTATE